MSEFYTPHTGINTQIGPETLLNDFVLIVGDFFFLFIFLFCIETRRFQMIRAFLPNMKARNDGHIVATSSVAAYTCAANIVPYAATKYGVTGNNNIYLDTSFVAPFFTQRPKHKRDRYFQGYICTLTLKICKFERGFF